jgi:phosphoserine phosphatase
LALAYSVGVGNSENDVPFLKPVAEPICFNPNSIFHATAKRQGRQVVVEKKNMCIGLMLGQPSKYA